MIDGDTFWVGDEKLRLFGIDAPELDQTCLTSDGRVWACGRWVAQQVSNEFQNLVANCETLERDRYGRRVGRCQVAEQDMGETLVATGLAFAYERYSTDYVGAEKAAMLNRLGLHSARVQDPAIYRRNKSESHQSESDPAPDPNCAIKGNIGQGDRRIYHMPGQRDYAHTEINVKRGERWFCSEREAQAAGWRPAQR